MPTSWFMGSDPIEFPDTWQGSDVPGGLGALPAFKGQGGAGWDFWAALQAMLGEQWSEYDPIMKYIQGGTGKRWKQPKLAQDMMEFAQLLKDTGNEDMAEQMVMSMIGQGFIKSNINIASAFAPLLAQWGMGMK